MRLLNLPLLLTLNDDAPVLALDEPGARPGRFGTADCFETEYEAPRALALRPRGFDTFGAAAFGLELTGFFGVDFFGADGFFRA